MGTSVATLFVPWSGAAMNGCYESDPGLDRVCSPLSKTSFFVPRLLFLSSQFPAISFGSFASCTRPMFWGAIDGVGALVLWVICER